MRHLDANPPDEGDIIGNELHQRARRVTLQAEYLSSRYSVVVANPPYMGSGNMDAKLSEFVKNEFPRSKSDLFAAFIERNLDLCVSNGRVAVITMQSWLFLPSFTKLRKRILEEHELLSMVHLGVNAFDTLNSKVVSTTAFVVQIGRGSERTIGNYVRLVEGADELAKSTMLREAASGADSSNLHRIRSVDLAELPGAVIAYWLSPAMRQTFADGTPLGQGLSAMNGMTTGENARFLRLWHEVSEDQICLTAADAADAAQSGAKWFPYNKGGGYRKWYGNSEYVINWEADGRDVIGYGHAFTRGRKNYFRPMVSWGKVSSSLPSFRYYPRGFLFDVAGTSMFAEKTGDLFDVLAFCNSVVAQKLLAALSPTLNYESGQIAALPVIRDSSGRSSEIAKSLVAMSREDWNSAETSWGFQRPAILTFASDGRTLRQASAALDVRELELTAAMRQLEVENNSLLLDLYGLSGEAEAGVTSDRVSLTANPEYLFGAGKSRRDYESLSVGDRMSRLVSYAVGCLFGRYSLDEPGLVLANQGDTLQDYLAKVPHPSFMPDADNVIPIVDGDWFEDDIVGRFRQFLRVAFREQRFEENLRFVMDALAVKDLRDYFVKSFYKAHVQRYRKRPIYWLFSSPKGSFNALIYMHRYTPSIASTVLNEYLREFKAKLEASRQHHERLAAGSGTPREKAAAQKEDDRLRNVLLELDEYEHDVLYPLATQQVQIDLDDGVKANYLKLGAALKKIPGLEASDE